jgi:hypothetical protein
MIIFGTNNNPPALGKWYQPKYFEGQRLKRIEIEGYPAALRPHPYEQPGSAGLPGGSWSGRKKAKFTNGQK